MFCNCLQSSRSESRRSDNAYELAITLGQYTNHQALYKCKRPSLNCHRSIQDLRAKGMSPKVFPRTPLTLSRRMEPSRAPIMNMPCPQCYSLGHEFKDVKKIKSNQDEVNKNSSTNESFVSSLDLPSVACPCKLILASKRNRIPENRNTASTELVIRNRVTRSRSAPDLHGISLAHCQNYHLKPAIDILAKRRDFYVSVKTH